jgi:hypothetical protein
MLQVRAKRGTNLRQCKVRGTATVPVAISEDRRRLSQTWRTQFRFDAPVGDPLPTKRTPSDLGSGYCLQTSQLGLRLARLSGRGVSEQREATRSACYSEPGSRVRSCTVLKRSFGGNCWDIEPWFRPDRLRRASGVTERRASIHFLGLPAVAREPLEKKATNQKSPGWRVGAFDGKRLKCLGACLPSVPSTHIPCLAFRPPQGAPCGRHFSSASAAHHHTAVPVMRVESPERDDLCHPSSILFRALSLWRTSERFSASCSKRQARGAEPGNQIQTNCVE